jgi:hypothetical protein
LRSETTPITLKAVTAGSCALSVVVLAKHTSAHSTLRAKCLT